MELKKILKTVSAITFLTLISKLFGFVRELLIAFFYGASIEIDMFIMAINIPSILFGYISCVGTAYTPVYAELITKDGKNKSFGFTNFLLLIMSIICGILIIFCFFNARILTKLSAPGFNEEMILITAKYLRISSWNILFLTLMNILICYLNYNGKFIQASLCMLLHSILQILFTVMSNYLGPIFLIIGHVFSNICYLLAVVIVSLKNGYSFNVIYYNSKYLKSLIKLVLPITMSSLITQINSYIDKYFASQLLIGSISALHYSGTIRTFIIMMLNTGLITIFYPVMSKMITKKDFYSAKKLLASSLNYVVIIFMPVTILLMRFSKFITIFLFNHGQFNDISVQMTAISIKMYALGIAAVALREIFFNFYYSVKETKFTLGISILTIGINIILDILLVNRYGVGGLALATSLSAMIVVPLLFLYVRKYLDFQLEEIRLLKNICKCGISNLFSLIILIFLENILKKESLFYVVLEGIVYFLIYLVVIKILNVKEVDVIYKKLKFRKNNVD